MKHTQADDNDLLDLVDQKDEVIGTIKQANAGTLLDSKAGFIRGTVAFIQNDEGKLWIPRRTADKRIAPNGIDFSVAEHVQSGETYEEAILRGFREELLLDLKKTDLKYLGKLNPVPNMPYFFTGVFLLNANEVKEYNQADYTGFEWLSPKEVVTLIDNGEPSKDALKATILEFL